MGLLVRAEGSEYCPSVETRPSVQLFTNMVREGEAGTAAIIYEAQSSKDYTKQFADTLVYQ